MRRSNPESSLLPGLLFAYAVCASADESLAPARTLRRRKCMAMVSKVCNHILFEASASATAVRISATENGLVITSCAIALRLEARSR